MWVKICGLKRVEDVRAAVDAGADAVGFVFEPSSVRYVGDSTTLHELVPPGIERVAVFATCRKVEIDGFTAVQYVDGEPPFGPKRFRVRRVEGPIVISYSQRDLVDVVVIDSHTPTKMGGTGEAVDWNRAAEIVRASKLPVVLAGGLTPDNVVEAIELVKPWGVDVSSGVETSPGVKDHGLIRAFVDAANSS